MSVVAEPANELRLAAVQLNAITVLEGLLPLLPPLRIASIRPGPQVATSQLFILAC